MGDDDDLTLIDESHMTSSNQVSEAVWQTSWASVQGKAHIDGNIPNQDSVCIRTSTDGTVICAVVSDGAGTASRSAEGSKAAAAIIANLACQLISGKGADFILEDKHVQFIIQNGVEKFYHHIDAIIKNSTKGTDRNSFHCTMTAWFQTAHGGFIAQVGDSAGISTRFHWREVPGPDTVDLFPDGQYLLHDVERGEYVNETHFITEPDWQKHLRIHKLTADIDAVVLMSDGAMEIAMSQGRVFRGFLSNLVAKLMTTPDLSNRNTTIGRWLSDPQTFGATGDDKTLLIAVMKSSISIFSNKPLHLGPSSIKPPAAALSEIKAPPQERKTSLQVEDTTKNSLQRFITNTHANTEENHTATVNNLKRRISFLNKLTVFLLASTIISTLHFFQNKSQGKYFSELKPMEYLTSETLCPQIQKISGTQQIISTQYPWNQSYNAIMCP